MGARTKTLYEVETANRALPLVRSIVRDVVADFRALRRAGRRQRTMQGHIDGSAEALERLRALGGEIEEASSRIERYLRELDDLGIELRDLESGAVDFPTLMCGVPAYLSWRLDEDEVAWWHAASDGYTDRQPLSDEVRAGLETQT